MIDIHCHILPNIDDGPKSIARAVEMASMAYNSGTRAIIATPHFLNPVYDVKPKGILDRVKRLNRALADNGVKTRILPGAEIRLLHNACALLDEGKLPSLAGSDHYLFELPQIFIMDGVKRVFKQLEERGITAIIAHPERNHTLMKHPELLKRLAGGKIKFQLTGDSLLGENGKVSRQIAKEMIQAGMAHFIASDAHDTQYRSPRLDKVFKMTAKITNKRTAQKILKENPGKLLERVRQKEYRLFCNDLQNSLDFSANHCRIVT